MTTKRLLGKTIAVPETRELDKLVRLLVEEGATALSYPLVGIHDAPDPAPVEAWIRELIDGNFDDVIFFTGEGVRRLVSLAERLGVLEGFTRELSKVRTVTRGPKPAAALHELGLRPTKPSRVPTSQGIIQDLAADILSGRRVGVQLYAENASQDLLTFLEDAGASVRTVTPYVYAAASDDDRVVELIDRLVGGAIDGVAFTSSAQVDRVFQMAAKHRSTEALLAALGRIVVAAVGPTCAASLGRRGARVSVVPERSFFMRSLVEELARAFAVPSEDTSTKLS
jgi:uroporphyrinogen-III synthase